MGRHSLRALGTVFSSVMILGATLAGCSGAGTLDERGSSDAVAAIPERTITSEMALADFDRVWEIINETHFDPEFNGVDWQAVGEELRPKAADARNRYELRAVLREALDRFGQSHFGIIPEAASEPESVEPMRTPDEKGSAGANEGTSELASEQDADEQDAGEIAVSENDESALDGHGDADTGIDIQIIDGQAVVSSVRESSPAKMAGVKMGWIISKVRAEDVQDGLEKLGESFDGVEFDLYGRRLILDNHLRGPPETSIDLTFLDGNDEAVELRIAREPMPGEFIKFGNLPPLSTHLEWSRVTTTSDSGVTTEIGVIRFNIWMVPIAPKFERAMYELRDVDGIIIDLRGNPGGIGGLSASIGRFLLDKKGSLGTMLMRGSKLSFNIEPVIITSWGEELSPFTGPIAILEDSGTASTSEVFAGGLQSLGRVEVFGTRSAGMALPAQMDKLPSGDVLLHAIANFKTSTGQQLEHGGVIPDVEVPLTRGDLLKGIDAPQKAAEDWIRSLGHE